ncbi:MAG: hypothetical protein KBS46_00755 [Clostridiales bacterium]|nr:hypothetical protein [Candidatus Apopatocola equi]
MEREQFMRVWERVSGESCPVIPQRAELLAEQLRLCSGCTELYRLLGFSRFLREKEAELKYLQTEYFLLSAETLPLLPRYGTQGEKLLLLREAINAEERSAALHAGGKWREGCRKRAGELREELARLL